MKPPLSKELQKSMDIVNALIQYDLPFIPVPYSSTEELLQLSEQAKDAFQCAMEKMITDLVQRGSLN